MGEPGKTNQNDSLRLPPSGSLSPASKKELSEERLLLKGKERGGWGWGVNTRKARRGRGKR